MKRPTLNNLTPQSLRESRKRLGFTQESLALLLGVSVGAIRNWEQGRAANPIPEWMTLILDCLLKQEARGDRASFS
jgi:DNA-binding transcriptional regulator YiaG